MKSILIGAPIAAAVGCSSTTEGDSADGICPATSVVFSGQINTALVSGITTAVLSGSFGVPNTPQGCGSSATMSVGRRTVPFEATGV